MTRKTKEQLTELFGKGNVRESKAILPDRTILIDRQGTKVRCKHTGFDILDSKEKLPSNWWTVFEDDNGKYHLEK